MIEHSYRNATGISLLLHGALLAFFLLLGHNLMTPVYSAVPITIEIVPASVVDRGDAVTAPASAAAAPTPRATAPQPSPTKTAPAAVRTEPLPAALPGESSIVSVAQPVSSGTGTVETAVVPGGGKESDRQGEAAGGQTSASSLYGPPPVYPPAARKAGWEGRVTVRVLIDADGSAASVAVRESSGYEVLDEAAVKAIKKWRFSPAKQRGQAIASFHDIRVRFRLVDAG